MVGLSAKKQGLAAEIQTCFKEKNMKPVLRTMCRRTAFQSPTTNDVRVSFDLDVMFLDEKAGIAQNPGKVEWCSNDVGRGPGTKTFGELGILEVKIKPGEKLPPWIKELQASHSIIPLPNLSKFCHGMCAFHYGSGKLDLQPYWFNALVDGQLGGIAQESDVTAIEVSPVEVLNGPPSSGVTSRWPFRKREADDRLTPQSRNGLPIAVKPKRPPEAKTFFANERTLLQWISPVTLVLSISIAMMGFSASLTEEARESMIRLSVTLMVLSCLWLAYALWIYFKRLRKIRLQDESGFDEAFGPSMMVASLFFVCVLALVFILASPFVQDDTTDETHLGRPCVNILAGFSDFPVLGIEPSGVIYHPGRDSVFVASPHYVLEIKNTPNKTIVDHAFPGWDIEAITIDPNSKDMLYLGIEGPNQIVAVNINTMVASTPVNVEVLMGNNHQLESLVVCPQELCGVGGKRFIVGGPSNSLRVLDLGGYPNSYPYDIRIIDEIDLDAFLCRRIGRCYNRTGRISDLYLSGSDLYAVAEKRSELFKIPWSATATSKIAGAAGTPEIMQLPKETNGGWQGFCLKPRSDGTGDSAILANDFHGFVKEFQLNSQGLVTATC